MKESVKPFIVLSISLLMVLLQTAGAFYSKSLALFAYVGLLILNAFSLLLELANLNDTDEGFRKIQFISVILNTSVLFILALIMISRALAITSLKVINMPLAEITTSITSAGLVICFFIDRQFIFIALMSLLIITGFSVLVFKKIVFLDSYLSIFFAVLITINSAFLIKSSFKMLKNIKNK
jgi:Co/Zn/Cd efflux system component